MTQEHWLSLALKRVLDVALSVILLAATWPLFFVIAVAIKLDSDGPVVFRQTRVGKNGKPFTLYKFRTMVKDAEARLREVGHLNEGGPFMVKIRNDPRITRVGKFLRRSSLDELPQLVNVLQGNMSLVGPRPQTPDEVALYNSEQRRRLKVKPGLTGLWQVKARGSANFDEWVYFDIKYIENWSLCLDFRIMVATLKQLLLAKGG